MNTTVTKFLAVGATCTAALGLGLVATANPADADVSQSASSNLVSHQSVGARDLGLSSRSADLSPQRVGATKMSHRPLAPMGQGEALGGLAGASDCCFDNGTPGCDDATCEAAVCACDPFCCDTAWDAFCAGPNGDVPGCSADELCAELCEGVEPPPPADGVVYSNVDNFQVAGFTHGGDIAADDLAMIAGGGVTEITFTIANFADSDLNDVVATLHFFELEVDGAGDIQEPVLGTELAIIPVDLEGIGLPPLNVGFFTIEDSAGFFDAPVNGLAGDGTSVIWAGISFSDAAFAGVGDIDDVGQGLFDPPTVGGSLDVFWLEGFGLAAFGDAPDAPVASFGWEIITEGISEGACCLGDGPDQCEITEDEDACDAIGGNFLGGGSSCANCPQPVTCPLTDDPACPEDLTGSGQVDVFDLLSLLDAWGPCPGCPQDLTGNGQVDVFDLLQLLDAWGHCPAGDGGDGQQGFIGDPCGVNNDGGCNSPNQDEFASISCGDTVCGTINTSFDEEDVAIRDTDWYEIVVTEDTQLEVSLHAEFASTFGILRLDEGCDNTTGQLATSPAGVPATTSLCVSPGTYAIVVTTDGLFGDDLPCGVDNEYTLSLRCNTCEIIGACCLDGGETCEDLSPAACAAAGGDYNGALLGPNVLCDDFGPCPQPGDSCGSAIPVDVDGGPVSLNNAGLLPLTQTDTCGLAPNDDPVVWFSFEGTGDLVEIKTCGSAFPTRAWLFCGPTCDALGCFDALDGEDVNDLCGSPVEWSATFLCTEEGQTYYVAVGARETVANPIGDIQLEVVDSAFPCTAPFDTPPDCEGPDDPGPGPGPEGCGEAGTGDCCGPTGTPGCEDEACCEAVCAGDPFCCDVEWDDFCAGEGFDPDCTLGPGQCGALNTPECDC